MYSLDELADELNRQEWAVERMLKNRGYLKQNGDPRKSTIDDGYMNKNGLITKSGWETFIDELGYKESDEDDDDEVEEDEIDDEEEDDENDDDFDEDEDDDNSDDEEEDDEEKLENELRERLSSEFSDENLIDDLVSRFLFFYRQDVEDDIEYFCEPLFYYKSKGHTDDFLRASVKDYNTSIDEIYCNMTEDEIADDIESVLRAKGGYSEKTIAWAKEEGFLEFCNVFSDCDTFERIFNEALEKGNDEEISDKYARNRMIYDDLGFDNIHFETYHTSVELCEISDDEAAVINWIEEKYHITVIELVGFTFLFNWDDELIWKAHINCGGICGEELEIEDFYLPTDRPELEEEFDAEFSPISSISGCMFDQNGICKCEDSRYCGSSCIGTCDDFYRS